MNQQLKTVNGNAKKRLLLIICIIVSIMLILVVCSFIIDYIEKQRDNKNEIEFRFYPADFEENIFDDEEYVELMSGEFMSYCDSATNVTVSIDRETASEYGKEVSFIADMIYTIIYGDNEEYNKYFSDKYYENNEPKQAFTMQKVYDIVITYVSQESMSSENGDNYTKSLFAIEYKILKNNGTFRRDIGNGSKKQYLTITDKTGELLIDHISTVNAVR